MRTLPQDRGVFHLETSLFRSGTGVACCAVGAATGRAVFPDGAPSGTQVAFQSRHDDGHHGVVHRRQKGFGVRSVLVVSTHT